MAPLVKGDKCDQPIKMRKMQENPLSILQPLQNDGYKTLVSTYTSEFPIKPLDAPKHRPFVYQPAIELSEDADHFGKLVTETRHNYDEKLPFLEPPVCSEQVRQSSIRMHSDTRVNGVTYQTSHQQQFPAQTGIAKRREKCVPSSETRDRVLPGDRTRFNFLSEPPQDKSKRRSVGKKEEKTETAVRTNRKRAKGTETQKKKGREMTNYSLQFFSSVLNLDPKDKIRQSMYSDEFRTFPTANRDKQTSDLMTKSSVRLWGEAPSYSTSSKEDYSPKIVKAEIFKPLLPQTHSDLPLGDRDSRREADRQQYNTYRHFFTEPPTSGLVRTHVSGANLRTKSNVEFAESVNWDQSTTNSNMFKRVPITEIPRRHRSHPPGAIPLDYYNDRIESSTCHSDFQPKPLPPKAAQDNQFKRRALLLSGPFRDETTQRMDFLPYDVNPRLKIESYQRQFSSVPLGTLSLTI